MKISNIDKVMNKVMTDLESTSTAINLKLSRDISERIQNIVTTYNLPKNTVSVTRHQYGVTKIIAKIPPEMNKEDAVNLITSLNALASELKNFNVLMSIVNG